MLTLASNERIPLISSMKLLLEINNMTHCSPATVSRGGVIFVSSDDIGWKPAVDSWLERLDCGDMKPTLSTMFRWEAWKVYHLPILQSGPYCHVACLMQQVC
jgi:dynein heavy chain